MEGRLKGGSDRVVPNAPAMRRPVLTSEEFYQPALYYAMSGTDLAYGAPRASVGSCGKSASTGFANLEADASTALRVSQCGQTQHITSATEAVRGLCKSVQVLPLPASTAEVLGPTPYLVPTKGYRPTESLVRSLRMWLRIGSMMLRSEIGCAPRVWEGYMCTEDSTDPGSGMGTFVPRTELIWGIEGNSGTLVPGQY
eukprot:3060707-Rhodomonas_salina.1